MESSQSKDYSYLIQPIRDLAENWNIDISKELEDYLSDLDKISFTFDGGDQSKSFNFAEAALLIQGSAVIYSKKVEYLYNLLFQTLDLLAQRRKRKDNTSIMADGTDRDVQMDDEVEFLALDDILVADDNIDLNEGDGSDESTHQNNKQLIEFGNNDSNYKIALMNNAGSNDHRAMLDSGLNDMDDDDGNPDGKKQLFITNNNNDLKRSDFRMNDAIVSRSGAMVLRGLDFLDHEALLQRPSFNQFENQYVDNSNNDNNNNNSNNDTSFALINDNSNNNILNPPDFNIPQDNNSTSNGNNDIVNNNNNNNNNNNESNVNSNSEENKQLVNANIEDGSDFVNFGGGRDDSSDDDNGGGMDYFDDEDEKRLQENNNENNNNNNNNNNNSTPDNKKPNKSLKSTIAATKKSKSTIRDAWELLDPFEDSGNKLLEKPFKKGKTFVIPFSLLESDKQKKQMKKMEENEKSQHQIKSKSSNSATSMSNPDESILVFPDETFPLRGCYFKELAYLYNKNIQQARKKLKEINGIEEGDINELALELLPEDDNGLASGYYGVNTSEPINGSAANKGGSGDDDEHQTNGPSWEDDDDWGNFGGIRDDDSSDEEDTNGLPSSSAIEHYDGPFDGNHYNFDNVNIPDENSARVEQQNQPTQTYEELCRSYVEKYLESASKYVRETALSQRVNEWNNRLMPILQEQDSHPTFDIHTYGNKFLNSMKPYATNKQAALDEDLDEVTDSTLVIDKEAIVSFKDITQNSPTYEICRMFTSCLQLANNGNIEIIQPESKDDIDQLNFHLLSLKKKHDIEGLQVPSQHKSSLFDNDEEEEEEQNKIINNHIQNSTPNKKKSSNNNNSSNKINSNNGGKRNGKNSKSTTTSTQAKSGKRQTKRLKKNQNSEDELSQEEKEEEVTSESDISEEEVSSDDEKIKKKQKTTKNSVKSRPKSKSK